MSDNEFPKMVYSDEAKPLCKETEAGSGLFYTVVADKEEEKNAVSDGFRLTVEKKVKRAVKKAK